MQNLGCQVDAGTAIATLVALRVDLENEATATQMRPLLIKRDIVASSLQLIATHSLIMHVSTSREVVEHSVAILALVARQSKKGASQLAAEGGTKLLLVLLRSFSKAPLTIVNICDALIASVPNDRNAGQVAKAIGGMDLLMTLCAKNGRKHAVTKSTVQLLCVFCRSAPANADAVASSKVLKDMLASCRRNAAFPEVCMSTLSVAVAAASRHDKFSALLSRADIIDFCVEVTAFFSDDLAIVTKLLDLLQRLRFDAHAVAAIQTQRLFSKLYPLIGLQLGRSKVLYKLCVVLWKLHALEHQQCQNREWARWMSHQTSVNYAPSQRLESDEVHAHETAGVPLIRAQHLDDSDVPHGAAFRDIVEASGTERGTLSEASSGHGDTQLEVLLKLVHDLNESRAQTLSRPRCVYCAPRTYFGHTIDACAENSELGQPSPGVLQFESRFESGNLGRVQHVAGHRYNLWLSADTNSFGHVQWFYFAIYGMRHGVEYRFNIVNLEKPDSMFNHGMRPVMFCPRSARSLGLGWVRCGAEIAYVQNPFCKDASEESSRKQTQCFSALMTLSLPPEMASRSACDAATSPVFIAYCFPYGVTNLNRDLEELAARPVAASRMRRDELCRTVGGISCPLLTITNFDQSTLIGIEKEAERPTLVPLAERPVMFLSARVHPGESNASWVMRGALRFLLSDDPVAAKLCDSVVFKVVPMLNPDGVAVGNHRCNLIGHDLNRQWTKPDEHLSPTIFHYRRLIKQTVKQEQRVAKLFLDMHGHSRKPGIFLYGCEDAKQFGMAEQVFPRLVERVAHPDIFNLAMCSHKIVKSKMNCARVAVWRDFRIQSSFTMEASMSGNCVEHFSLRDLERMGQDAMRAAWDLVDPAQTQVNRVRRELQQSFPKRFLQPLADPAVAVPAEEARERDSPRDAKTPSKGRRKGPSRTLHQRC
ncbi:Cytosolic carboxypeptidase 1 (ATP/GTP-binding protein 1) (Nervous system nuclear protein induced by axotomy protein 1 homolog) [Durusdinium trenchii]|uniref:tubulin-glutamate carboxypeptidase n=1 Tax=Durusdinium trenchii TaxID=1381693 RepID=A0ABP0J9D0_9DINO